MVHSVHTGSQICGLAWSGSVNELLSTHGYADNALHLWKAPNLTKIGSLKGHTRRTLYLAMSPNGQTAATGAGSSLPLLLSALSGTDKLTSHLLLTLFPCTHTSLGIDGYMSVGDETVRMWRVFPAAKKASSLKDVSMESRCRIR